MHKICSGCVTGAFSRRKRQNSEADHKVVSQRAGNSDCLGKQTPEKTALFEGGTFRIYRELEVRMAERGLLISLPGLGRFLSVPIRWDTGDIHRFPMVSSGKENNAPETKHTHM